MKTLNTYHHSRIHSLLHSDFANFEFSVWLHMIGWSIISLFVPVLLLTAGYSLAVVLGYEAVLYLIDVPLNFLASKMVKLYGARVTTITATFLAIAYFVVFHYVSIGSWSILLLLALFAALYDTFYWVAHIYLFIESSGKKQDISKNNGIINGIRSLSGMLGPAIGAVILLFGSELALLVTSILFLAVSIIPLLSLRHTKDKPGKDVSFKEFFKELPERKNFLTWFLYSFHSAADSVIWPLFIFTIYGTLQSIALVAIVISVSKIVLSYVSGAVSQTRRERLIFFGLLLTLLVWIARITYANPVFYYVSIVVISLSAILVEVPIDSAIFERARLKDQSLAAATYRNAIIMFPQGVLFAILALLVGVFKISFIVAIATLAILLVVNQMLLHMQKSRQVLQ
jgi:MFS family permease